MTEATRPTFGKLELIRLWFSYQRYVVLLAVGMLGIIVVPVVAVAPWYWWLPVGIAVAKLQSLAAHIDSRWPRKLRATTLARRRISMGRFRVVSIRNYCGDPCFRVVAREILATAGIPARQRRDLIRQFSHSLKLQPDVLVFVDKYRRVHTWIAGNRIERATK